MTNTTGQSRTLLDVPFEDKEQAKAAGARWDGKLKRWYAPEGTDLAEFARWNTGGSSEAGDAGESGEQTESTETHEPTEPPPDMDAGAAQEAKRTYLVVPFGEKQAAKAAGARWDVEQKCWYARAEALSSVQRWLPKDDLEQGERTGPVEQFAEALREMGLNLEGKAPEMDGEPHRVGAEGDKRGERGGFYVGYLDGRPAGYIKNHRTGIEITWKAEGVSLSDEELSQVRARAAEQQQSRAAERLQGYVQAARRLRAEVATLLPVTQPTPYLVLKGVGVHGGVFQDDKGTTVVPAFSIDGTLWTVQYIGADGTKRFAKGSRKAGCFHVVGGLSALKETDVLIVTEGYATAATAAELLQRPAIAAFDSGNLLPVCEALRRALPGAPILVVSDDDQAQESRHGFNPGKAKAREAARAVGGQVLVPMFAPGEQESAPERFSDFNDLANHSALGRDGARRQAQFACDRAIEHAKQDSAQRHEPTLPSGSAGDEPRVPSQGL